MKDLSELTEEYLNDILNVLKWKIEYREDTTFGKPDILLKDKNGNKCLWWYDSGTQNHNGYCYHIRDLNKQGLAYVGKCRYDRTDARLEAISKLQSGLRWKIGNRELQLPFFKSISELKIKLDIMFGKREIYDIV